MIVPEKLVSWFSELTKNKAYYQKQIFEEDTQFYEYISETNLDADIPEDYEYIDEHRDTIFNSIFDLMLAKRDSFLVGIENEFSMRNIFRIRLGFLFYFLFINTLVFSFGKSPVYNIIIFSLAETVYVSVIDIVMYRITYKYFAKKIMQYSYEVYDKDAKEYYDSYGKIVFGANFLSDYTESDKGYKIQIFKDKASDSINSVCVVKPIVEDEGQITMRIGFMGTSTDKKLRVNIFNKMVEKVLTEQQRLKQDYPGLRVSVKIVLRPIDRDLLLFLKKFKDFKFLRYETNEFKLCKGFEKVTFVKD